ncbi:MAG: lysylphosphatidylglycerol synthase transmembrane domain-containing protein [Rickettsiales bacterium]|nr:lysylphosphatidylglycerol synthase transmembrane domain-containing protein [Rickettsiales bacterium]
MLHHLSQSKLVKLLLKLGLTLLAFWLVFQAIDLDHLIDIVRTQDQSFLVEASFFLLIQILLGAMRWHMIVRAISEAGSKLLSFAQALRLYYISVFFNCCLPGTVGGDVIRVWLAKAHQLSLSQSIHSVIIDRVIALVALIVLVCATLPLLAGLMGFTVWPLWLAVAFLFLLGVWVLYNAHRLFMPLSGWAAVRWLLYFLDSLKLLLKKPAMSLSSLLYALIAHVSYCLCCVMLAKSMHVELSILDSITLLPPVLLITILPIAIGGWGLREVGMIGMLALADIPKAQAALLGIEIGLLNIVMTLPAGIMWLVSGKHNYTAHKAVQDE